MPLPYASDYQPSRRPYATWALILLTTATAILLQAGDHLGEHGRTIAIINAFGLVPGRFRPYTLITYPFLHENIPHLLINLFYLWVFGSGVEEAVGSGRFLLLYLSSGIVGGALQCLVTLTLLPAGSANVPIIGASAACAGLIGLFAARYYRSRLSFVGLPFRPHVVLVVALFLLYEIAAGLWNLLHGSTTGGVANWAHIGGFIFGLGCAQFLHLGEIGRRAYLQADAARAMDHNVPGAAIKRWESLLAREPENPLAHTEMARAWLLLGDMEVAHTHFLAAIRAHLAANHRSEAARLFAEMRDNEDRPSKTARASQTAALRSRLAGVASLSTAQLFALGSALEEQEQFPLAAETLRLITVRDPDSTEAETALLKVVHLYVHHLRRFEEAKILLRLFLERYPHSQWRALADELQREAQEN